jgi:hypothetical protein
MEILHNEELHNLNYSPNIIREEEEEIGPLGLIKQGIS